MKVSPKYVEMVGSIPKNARVAETTVSNPVKAAGLVSAVAASALAASAMLNPEITVNGIENKLLKSGYQKDENGNLIKKFTPQQKEELEKKYGYPHKNFVKLYETPLKPQDLKEFKEFAEINKEKGKKLYNNHFDNLFLTYLIMKNNGMISSFQADCQNNKDNYTLVENIVKSNPSEYVGIASDYKADCSSEWSTALRVQANDSGYKMDKFTQNSINKLSDFINTQTVPESVKLYRGEGYEVLNNVQLDNGKIINLGDMMKEAATYNDENMINEIKELVLDNEITAVQPGFMSTTLNHGMSDAFALNRIDWEFEVAPNTKGAYIDASNLVNLFSRENEVLLQKGSKIKIKDIEFDNEKCVWKLKAEVSNN